MYLCEKRKMRGEPMQQENKDVFKTVFTIPNVLSFARLCMIPLIIWLYCVKDNYVWTGYVIIVSGATDVIDGFIARTFHMVSDLGKILDPIADKFTQATVLFCLLLRYPMVLLPLIAMTLKETFVGTTGFMVIQKNGKVMGAVWHGKVATLLLYAMMMLHLFWHDITPLVSNIFIIACTVMICVSFFFYGAANIRALKQAEAEKKAAEAE